jgi:hypothetical protein
MSAYRVVHLLPLLQQHVYDPSLLEFSRIQAPSFAFLHFLILTLLLETYLELGEFGDGPVFVGAHGGEAELFLRPPQPRDALARLAA